MGVLLAAVTRTIIEKSIERPVSMELVEEHFEQDSIDYIMDKSDNNCIRCWGMAKDKKELFEETERGDSLLLTEKGTGLFTHYGLIIGKVKSKRFGQTLWRGYKESPWKYIYFLTNVHKIAIDKNELLFYLGEIPTVQEPIRITLPKRVNLFAFLNEDEEIQQIFYPESYLNIDKQFKPIRARTLKPMPIPGLKKKVEPDIPQVNKPESFSDTAKNHKPVKRKKNKTAREANILIATDKEYLADEVVDNLILNGYKCPTVVCGDEVLGTLQRDRIDVLITEMVMHDINGMEIVKYKNEYSPDTKVVLLIKNSKANTVGDAIDAMIEGAELYVSCYNQCGIVYWVSKVVWQLGLTRKRGYSKKWYERYRDFSRWHKQP